jgi:membrane protein
MMKEGLMPVPDSVKQLSTKKGIMRLYDEMSKDNVFYTAGGVAYFLLFAIFPAMVFFLSLLPYLPIPNLHQAVMDLFYQVLPQEAASEFEGVIAEVTTQQRAGLLSFGAIATLWAASSGVYASMQFLNGTYGVPEGRPYWKTRGMAILLTLMFAVLVIGAFGLIIFGGVLQDWLVSNFGLGGVLLVLFAIFRWLVIFSLLLLGFALMYYFGPDVDQKFKFITPGSVVGVVILAVATVGFRIYIENFGDYSATYGSLGAVMILMLWLYIVGLVLLIGSEINAIVEDTAPEGKNVGQRRPGFDEENRTKGSGRPGYEDRRQQDWERRPISDRYRAYPAGVGADRQPAAIRYSDVVLAIVAFMLAMRRRKRKVT